MTDLQRLAAACRANPEDVHARVELRQLARDIAAVCAAHPLACLAAVKVDSASAESTTEQGGWQIACAASGRALGEAAGLPIGAWRKAAERLDTEAT